MEPFDARSRGVRALVLLHDREIRRFLEVWRRAKAEALGLPETDDPSYASLDALCSHVLGAARWYMVWSCETLGLPAPAIEPSPAPAEIDGRAEAFAEHLLAGWRTPLAEVEEERLDATRDSSWGVPYCVDSMLEHAVMHPVRHRFQLEELLGVRGG